MNDQEPQRRDEEYEQLMARVERTINAPPCLLWRVIRWCFIYAIWWVLCAFICFAAFGMVFGVLSDNTGIDFGLLPVVLAAIPTTASAIVFKMVFSRLHPH